MCFCKQRDEDTRIVEALCERRKLILDNIRDNDEAGAIYRQVADVDF